MERGRLEGRARMEPDNGDLASNALILRDECFKEGTIMFLLSECSRMSFKWLVHIPSTPFLLPVSHGSSITLPACCYLLTWGEKWCSNLSLRASDLLCVFMSHRTIISKIIQCVWPTQGHPPKTAQSRTLGYRWAFLSATFLTWSLHLSTSCWGQSLGLAKEYLSQCAQL